MHRALVIRHVAHEGIAGYRDPIEEAGYAIKRVAACSEDLTGIDPLENDLVVVMGGPMGVYETADHPWLTDEIAFLRARFAADRPTLGVCLGAQLIAAALGSAVHRGPVREIGFGPVSLTSAGASGPLSALAGVPMLHWHGDTFDVPEGTELLASTHHYAQAFARGSTILALQFHAEMGEDPRFEQWLANDAREILEAGTDEARLRADHAALGPSAVRAGRAMLARWLAAIDLRG